MAEIDQSGGGKKGGKKRSKKASTKIDMTPMVDLGFLLITFFMLTTTLAKPVTMQLSMPDKTETKETSPVKASETLTVLPDENKVYYYQGKPGDATTVVQVTDYSDQGIRQVLFRLKKQVGQNFTIVIVTHNMQQAARVSDRTAFFHLGNLIEIGNTNDLFTNPQQKRTEDYITGRYG